MALGPLNNAVFAKLRGLSRSGRPLPLANDSDGVLFADGAAAVVLKRLSRARTDGDTILGVICAVGTSSDGRGKSVAAPNARGQRLAIERAHALCAGSEQAPWIVTHATGTPTGDRCEYDVVRDLYGHQPDVWLTANKSVVGHTGWAAGLVSLIEALLGLQRATIPPNARLAGHADIGTDAALHIPREPVAWPVGRPRCAAVSSFGFGGTDAHLIVATEKAVACTGAPAHGADDDCVIVGWAARLPGLDDGDACQAWLCGNGQAPAASFGSSYSGLAQAHYGVAPRALRTVDRTHLLAIECARAILDQAPGDIARARTGIFIGHSGKTRHARLNGLRCYLDDARQALQDDPDLAATPDLPTAHEHVRANVREAIPPLNEDSFPGMMPNVIAGRVANCLDLHGPAMAIDTGASASLAALEVAMAYLADKSIDVALVGGVNGVCEGNMREGAFMLAVTRSTTARELKLPVMATVACEHGSASDGSAATDSYGGAEGLRQVIRAVLGAEREATVRIADRAVRISCPAEDIGSSRLETVVRHVVRLKEMPDEPCDAPQQLFPSRTLILTHTPELRRALAERAPDATIINTAVDDLREETLGEFTHLRVVADLAHGLAPATALVETNPELLCLHDTAFLAAQHMRERLCHARASCVGIFLNALHDGVPHPVSGLWGGLFNGLGIELEPCTCAALLTSATDLPSALAEMETELRLRRIWPAVYRDGPQRYALLLDEAPLPDPPDTAAEPRPDTVVLAIGGTRGATAAVLEALAQTGLKHLHLIGSTALEECCEAESMLSDSEFNAGRAAFISAQHQLRPDLRVRDIIAQYRRKWAARMARRTLATLRATCGDDRVSYHCCDVTNRSAVNECVHSILAREGRIDLVVYGAGFDRSQSLAMKSLDDFRAVRNVKCQGYINVKAALAGHQPAWINFGSIVSAVPCLPGQVDYLAANSFLFTAAQWAAAHGARETTLGWTIWGETGMFTDPDNSSVAHVIRDTGFFTEMTTREGVALFLRELGTPDPAVTYLGAREHTRGAELLRVQDPFRQRLLPQFTHQPAAQAAHQGKFYIDRIVRQTVEEVELERAFSFERDDYLDHHRVNGQATLPGTFVAEIAAEAARVLVPELTVVAFHAIEFKHFLRVRPGRPPLTVRIRAQVRSRSAAHARLAVQVVSDVIAPQGQVLQRDREHFRLDVEMAATVPPAPAAPTPDDEHMQPVCDPYHCTRAPVHLSGPFVTTVHTRANARAAAAELHLQRDPPTEVFGAFMVPVLLLDGLARVAALRPDELLPLAAPRRITCIELFTNDNDTALVAKAGNVRLQAEGSRSDGDPGRLHCEECTACDESGRVRARITGLDAVVTGYIDTNDGSVLTVAQAVARRASTEAVTAPEPLADALHAAVRDYQHSVQQLAQPEAGRSFDQHITLMTGHLHRAQALGEYYFERTVSAYDGAWVEVDGRRMLMLASYSYLDLLQHPAVTGAAKAAIDRFGTGTHGARLLAGTNDLHHELEQSLAAFKGTQEAVVFPSGYVTNLSTISTLVGEGDTVICDSQNHASIADGAAFSKARCLGFSHHDLRTLEQRLGQCTRGRTLVVVDAVFSMDGDVAPLPELIELCRAHGAWLMVDEAHSIGVLGATGRGVCEHFGLDGHAIQVHMGTLSKSLASVGGYIAASTDVVCALKNHARGFVFSAALPPAQTAAANAALHVLEREPARVARLQRNAGAFRAGLQAAGFNTLKSTTAIVPVICPNVVATLKMAHACWDAGVFVIPVFYPAVPLELPRLRAIVTAAHSDDDVALAVEVLEHAGRVAGVLPSVAAVPSRSSL
jgi:8-amino-7-oxononanoate synthase